jgi:hypothetical protein
MLFSMFDISLEILSPKNRISGSDYRIVKLIPIFVDQKSAGGLFHK